VSAVAPLAHAQSARPADEFTSTVKPIFEANCTHCHNQVKSRGGLSLETRDRIYQGGKMDGPVIVPGHPERSLLVALIRHEGPAHDPMPMPPPPRAQLTPAQIAAITKWIQDGAVIP
jgi:mono/diheme cytochrome c family protein